MRVLTATIRYPPAPGGVETHAHEVAKEMVMRGHQEVVYTSDLCREHPWEQLDGPYDPVDGVTAGCASAWARPAGSGPWASSAGPRSRTASRSYTAR